MVILSSNQKIIFFTNYNYLYFSTAVLQQFTAVGVESGGFE